MRLNLFTFLTLYTGLLLHFLLSLLWRSNEPAEVLMSQLNGIYP